MTGMKKMLIAATTVGAALAGTILYLRQRSSRPALDNTKDTKQLQDRGNGELHRPPMHAMG